MLTNREAILSETPTVEGDCARLDRVRQPYSAITISSQMGWRAHDDRRLRRKDAYTSAFTVLVAPVGFLMQVDLHALHAG